MATVRAEGLAVTALRDYLLRTLPAKITSINSGRATTLRSPLAESYVVTAGMTLQIATAPGVFSTITLTTGTRTAAQIVTDINAVVNIATADSKNRVLLTSATAPSGTTVSSVWVRADTTGANAIFGWDPGGEKVVREAVEGPNSQGIRDGDHSILDLRQGFGIIIGDKRTEEAKPNIRYDERIVTMNLAVHVPIPQGSVDSYSEHAESCIRAIREVVYEDRTLDAQVALAEIGSSTVYGPAFRFEGSGVSPLVARADMQMRIRIYERD